MLDALDNKTVVRTTHPVDARRNGKQRSVVVLLANALLHTVLLRIVQGDIASGRQTFGDNSASAYSLLSCYNAEFKPHPLSFEEFLSGKISRSFRLHRIWWSKRQIQYPLGLFTHLSVNRVNMLEAQCRSYPGGLVAAAVWVPLVATAGERTVASFGQGRSLRPSLSATHRAALREASSVLGDLFRRMEFQEAVHDEVGSSITGSGNGAAAATTVTTNVTQQHTMCSLRILLVYELVADEQLAVLMPVNHLRNTAMLAVDTPLASMVDVDLSVSWSLAGQVMADRASELVSRAQKDRVGWVIPAWDVDQRIEFAARGPVADTVLAVRPAAKPTMLRDMWKSREEILPFAFDRYRLGHNGTQFERWLSATSEYPITFEEGYEPWFFAYRKYLSLYDVRFRGHYYDKIANVRHVVRNGVLSLLVAPDVWLVHRPHGVSVQNNLYAQLTGKASPMDKPAVVNGTAVKPRDVYLRAALHFYKTVVAQMNVGRYQPLVAPMVARCRRVLPWWQNHSGEDEDWGEAAEAAAGRRRRRR